MTCERKIPNQDALYRKCHQNHWDFEYGCPESGAVEFDKVDQTISVNWSGLIMPEQVLPLFDTPEEPAARKSGLISIRAGTVRAGSTRECNLMDVEHTPHDPAAKHPSHSSIRQVCVPFNRTRAYDLLLQDYEVVVPVPHP